MSELTTPPEHDELQRVLVRYFGPTISSDQVDQLRRDVAALLADDARYRGVVGYLAPGNRFGEGQAWREEYVGFQPMPTTMNLALVLAVNASDRFPPPLPHCPEQLVGRWEMVAREDGLALSHPQPEWNLSADGTFRGSGEMSNQARWCAHKVRQGGDEIWVFPRDLPGRTSFIVKSVDGAGLVLFAVNRGGPLTFRRWRP